MRGRAEAKRRDVAGRRVAIVAMNRIAGAWFHEVYRDLGRHRDIVVMEATLITQPLEVISAL